MTHYPLFDFATPPRTGSVWFLQACAIAGLGERSHGSVHQPHTSDGVAYRVTMVRHPCHWLQAYYTTIHRCYLDVPCVDIFHKLPADGFDNFVRGYLRTCPGAVGRMFDAYGADTLLRLEDQPRAFIELLDMCGYKFNPNALKSLDAANRARKRKPLWTPSLYEAVWVAEKSFAERFDYVQGSHSYSGA